MVIRNPKARASLALTIMLCLCTLPLAAQGSFRDRIRARLSQQNNPRDTDAEKCKIAGLDVAIWRPTEEPGTGLPLVIFSHGFHGSNTQSIFIMKALAQAGYLVIAPNHSDAIGGGGGFSKPDIGFQHAEEWSDTTYKNRGEDITRLLGALRNDPKWSSQIDWTKVGLCGHSLGGYTVLALAGAWPSWKLPGIKAVLALSPYCAPFVQKGNLGGLGVPVMYQGGTRDLGITPTVKRPGGAFSKTASPAEFVEFEGVGHFSWSNLNRNSEQQDLINHYCVSFLDKYVKGDTTQTPEQRLAGVSSLQTAPAQRR